MKLYFPLVSLVVSAAVNSPSGTSQNPKLQNSVNQVISKFNEQKNQTQTNSTNNTIVPQQQAPIAKIGSEQDGKNFINFASAAYCPQASLINWNCANCVGVDSAGFLAINNNLKLIVLSYRGTNDLENWLYDLDLKFISAGLTGKNSNAQIHAGFEDMASSLLSQTINALKPAIGKYPDYKIVITGHSLGGAIAALIGFQLAQTNVISWDKLNVITYGQPRVGNPEFASYLNSKAWTFTRITSYSDIVPISPGVSMGYYHNQYNMHINKIGKTIKCSIYEEDNNCIADFWIPSEQAHFNYWNLTINSDC